MNMTGVGFIERIPVRAQRIDKTEIQKDGREILIAPYISRHDIIMKQYSYILLHCVFVVNVLLLWNIAFTTHKCQKLIPVKLSFFTLKV